MTQPTARLARLSTAVSAALGGALLTAPGAWAHEGHGLEGAHWHATDVWGFVVAAVVAAMAVVWWRGRK